MDPAYRNKKIVDLTEEEAKTLSSTFPTSSTIGEADTLRSQLSNDSDAHSIVSPPLISEFEAMHWYHGISDDPPKLMWRSDIESNPFPRPVRGAHFFNIPRKTAYGVFNTPLNAVWGTVAPEILASMKAHGLKYSALKTARFSTVKDSGEETFGPVVIWIGVRPNTTNAEAVRDATPDILDILAKFQIDDVVVEWYEGSVERLVGPPLMSVSSPIFGLNHPFNTGLGIPIARQSDDGQGTIALLFREMKTSNGDPSDRILALTNKHVASADTTTPYELDEANPQYIVVCGKRRHALAVAEIEDAIEIALSESSRLFRGLEDLKLKSGGANIDALIRQQAALDARNKNHATLETFFNEVQANWQDINGRRLGEVDWAPEISVRVDDLNYTRDIATFTVDREKLGNFEHNIIDLGNQYTAGKLRKLFWPIDTVRRNRKIPDDLQLPITRALPPHLVNTPDMKDRNGDPHYVVAKYGSTTKLTLGHYSPMEAYISSDLGLESREIAVYNYSRDSLNNFSAPGDSGSLIFTGSGDGLAILHTGMKANNHVTYGTPLWWVIKQILVRYPHAEFCGINNTLD